MNRTDTMPLSISYTVSITVTRPVASWQGEDTATEIAESAEWMVSAEAKRELEREMLRALRVIDGDCDAEVMETQTRGE